MTASGKSEQNVVRQAGSHSILLVRQLPLSCCQAMHTAMWHMPTTEPARHAPSAPAHHPQHVWVLLYSGGRVCRPNHHQRVIGQVVRQVAACRLHVRQQGRLLLLREARAMRDQPLVRATQRTPALAVCMMGVGRGQRH
jgi:hypothetical protein